MSSKLLARAGKNLKRTAIISNKQAYSYEHLLTAAETIRADLAKKLRNPANGLNGSSTGPTADPPRVGLYAAPGPEYLAATWAVWQAGGIVVPLATSHPPPELSYVCADAGVSAVLSPPDQESRLGPIAREAGAALQLLEPIGGEAVSGAAANGNGNGRHGAADAAAAEAAAAAVSDLASDVASSSSAGALIIYTSGTTGRPKGALHTHRSLHAQVSSLASAWGWSPSDHLLHCLPLHHIHGIVNGLYTPAAVGAAVELAPKFSPTAVWQRLEAAMRAAAAGLRLTVSGSSACPVPIMERWRELSGKYLLERYGMTEIGMALSNPYQGERRPGCVGTPLPWVEVALDAEGQLLVRGPAVFDRYWGRPDATRAAFDAEGYFLTGDTASTSGSPPYYRIDGRTSIESVILEHPAIAEVAVLGVPDETFGEVVTALVAAREPPQTAAAAAPGDGGGGATATVAAAARPDVAELQRFCRDRLAPYQVPKRWQWVASLPRNAMGKVNKKELLRALQAGQLA
ncbi:hypothetical protein GPECTOR_59g624 [Gonium pectorale]|uniref:AMP-dependent synthetase/ligase domain-containing protein n=1 Tax=Gonium pectorale TaxID=33097 RepID=A0A150G594_GONPE|nr:hypothetical protein GPECTOR_59g624 [Gonium pectorale]|eukprot:KXZ45017.1 hypothetical protein GPECTOR_59g624 [Gonium pectorale]